MKKNTVTYLLLLFLLGNVSIKVYADDAVTQTKTSKGKAVVLNPISLVNLDVQGLKFGSISIGNSDSKVRVAPSQTVPSNVTEGDAVVLPSTQTAAKFQIAGVTGLSYQIILPASVTLVSGSGTLTVNNFLSSKGPSGNGVIGTGDIFWVGADLNVPNSALLGTYSGTFSVSVAYN
jgi:hypothetical protein